ncbi:hypothetical protein [Aquimonas sp.]|uniref:hypothetical protein n=1 Tax=Aquimonas sp. TaxID=1872588 RepID=UPI0037BE9751
MDRFLEIALSFPTLILSVLLMVAVGYWLLGLLGLLELDVLDLPDSGDSGIGAAGGLSALMMKFGLAGLPFALIFTALVFVAWICSYFVDYFLLGGLASSLLRIGLGLLATPVLLFLALPVAGLVLQPLRGLFARAEGLNAHALLGETAVVRSPTVDAQHGSAEYHDGGAGLILQVRTDADSFRRGDRVLIVEYLEAHNAYRVTRP